MVKTGCSCTFGVALKDFLSVRLKNWAIAMASGTTLASLLQSSTAATLIVASIQAEGFLTTNMAFATILGADFGSALMTRVLTFDLSFLSPLLIFIGTCLFFMRKGGHASGQFGRILIGLGIIMLCSASSWPPRCRCARARSSRLFLEISHSPILAVLLGLCLGFGCFEPCRRGSSPQASVTAGVIPVSTGLWWRSAPTSKARSSRS